MSEPHKTWAEIRAAEDAAVIAEGFVYLAKTARRLMPLLNEADAQEMRAAIFSGDADRLMPLVQKHWVKP